MLISYTKLASAVLFAAACGRSLATGNYEAPTMLSDGGKQTTGTPEFYWEFECKRIAREFVPLEKRVVPPAPPANQPKGDEEENAMPNTRGDFTSAMDLADFQAALHDGSLKPADPKAATETHKNARDVVKDASSTRTDDKLPDETPGEFADYHKGAFAYKTKHPDEGRTAWETLLARPAAERKYRSTWAAYMLGRSALDEHQFDKAAGYFQQTRKLAQNGFVDSLGLAAESYGWEARCALETGHPESSARLYLTQLATGDPSAVVSLKWFIPDWGKTVKGDENAKPGVSTDATEAPVVPGPATDTPRGAKALADAARSPLLRRLVCAHILATATPVDSESNEYLQPAERGASQAKWLAALDMAGVNDTPDAEYIAWVAYSAGKYPDAKRWLAKCPGTSAAALWLKAKFALRDGKLADGTKLLSQALHNFPAHDQLENSMTLDIYRAPADTAQGELGVLRLAQADFIQALDAFIAAGFWNDAAYIAERCLTKDELLNYTRSHHFTNTKPARQPDGGDMDHPFSPKRFCDLVARRLVREDDYQTAKEFFAPEMIPVLDDYTTSLAKGGDTSKSKQEQARALFHAAWIARYQGMELMGTEVGPDNTAAGGDFNEGDLAMARLTGKQPVIEDMDQDAESTAAANKPLTFTLPVTKLEQERLQATKLVVERRFHYRHVAAGLVWKAAGLLPDNAPETADILNAAGNWLKQKHEKQARRFFLALKTRCPNTEIGKAALAKHWFVDAEGPWSKEEKKPMPKE